MIKMIKKQWRRFRYVIKDLDGNPYLIRYRLIVTKWGCVYLHHIIRSDGDRELHDHPFNFTVILLWRGYVEYSHALGKPFGKVKQVSRWCGWLSVIRHKATDAHRLELYNGPVWSLFIRGPKIREWGFYLDNKDWVTNQYYHEFKQKEKDDKGIQPRR